MYLKKNIYLSLNINFPRPTKFSTKTTPKSLNFPSAFHKQLMTTHKCFFQIRFHAETSATQTTSPISSYHLHSLPTVFSIFLLLLFIAPCLQRSCYTFWSLRNFRARLLLLLAPAVLVSEDFSFSFYCVFHSRASKYNDN